MNIITHPSLWLVTYRPSPPLPFRPMYDDGARVVRLLTSVYVFVINCTAFVITRRSFDKWLLALKIS